MDNIIKIERGLLAPRGYPDLSEKEKNMLLNKCGGDTITAALVPNTIIGTDISEACNIHDWMYINGKTKKEKALADFIFDQNIKTLINSEKDSAFKYYIKRTIGKIYVTTARFAYLFEEMFVR